LSRNNNTKQYFKDPEDRIIITAPSEANLIGNNSQKLSDDNSDNNKNYFNIFEQLGNNQNPFENNNVNYENFLNQNFFAELNNNNNVQPDYSIYESSGESSNSNKTTDNEEEEIMSIIIKPPKFSGTSSEDPREWFEDYEIASKANGWNEDRMKSAFGAHLRKGA
jgi:hypothetical protein